MRNLKGFKGTLAVAIFVLYAGVTSAQAVDVLDGSDDVSEHGSEWSQPEMKLAGHGTLEYYGEELDGDISCEVGVSAIRDRSNSVEIDDADGDIEANSNTATLTLSNCEVSDDAGRVTKLGKKIVLRNGEVSLKIEGYDNGYNDEMTFDKVEIEGRYDKRHKAELKMALVDGTITPVVEADDVEGDSHVANSDSEHDGDYEVADNNSENHDTEYDSEHESDDNDSEHESDDSGSVDTRDITPGSWGFLTAKPL